MYRMVALPFARQRARAPALKNGETKKISGKQERHENLLNQHLIRT
jgi:hypothetical protein